MKIAKKVLALVMAVAMIASLSAMAFADTTWKYDLSAKDNGDGTYTVTLSAKNAEGLKVVDGELAYDSAVLAQKGNPKSGDFVNAYNALGTPEQTVIATYNKEAGKVIIGVAVSAAIVSDEAYAQLCEDNDTDKANITTDEFVICTVKFNVLDASAKDVKLTYTDKDGSVVNLILNETVVEPETTTAPVAPTDPNAPTEPVAPTEPDSNKADDDDKKATDVVTPDDTKGDKGDKADGDDVTGNAVPTDVNKNTNGNKTTGDNMALAAAASVVVLAGAAFVFTKKRK